MIPRSRDSRVALDVAAGRPVDPDHCPSSDSFSSMVRHGLVGLMAESGHPHLATMARGAYTRLASRQQAMEQVLSDVLQQFASAGVRATVVKGPALARWAYRQPRLRTYTDLDVVVPADEVKSALDVLRSYDLTVGIPPKTPKADKRNIPIAHPSGVRFTIDLHWDLFSYTQLRGSAAGATEEAWARAEWDPDSDLGPMWRFPREILVAFLATHALLDHRFRLILFRDLAEVAATGLDWERLVNVSRRYGLRSSGYTAWHIARSVVDAEIPGEVLDELRLRSLPVAVAERLLPRTDLVQFDGHRPDLLNLAMVLMHDERTERARRLLAAPFAFPNWMRRVEHGEPHNRPRLPGRAVTRRKVVHLLPLDVARGAQTYAKAMRDLLDSEKVQHRTVKIFRSEEVGLDPDLDLDVPTHPGRRLGFSPAAFVRLWRFLRRSRPDVLVAHGGESLKYAAFSKPKSTRLVYYKIGAADPKLSVWWRRRLYRALVAQTDLVAGVSPEMLTETDVLVAVPQGRTVLIPNGRDPERFTPRVHADTGEPVTFSLVGRLESGKRPFVFLDLIEELRKRGLDVRGVVVGDGPLLDDVRRRAGPEVDILGRRDDVPELLSTIDVLVLVSAHEGMPGVLIEAGMAGLPALTTDVEGAREVVEDGVTGVIVARDDFAGLVEAATRLAGDPCLRDAMGGAARIRCLERFTLTAGAERWAAELERLGLSSDQSSAAV